MKVTRIACIYISLCKHEFKLIEHVAKTSLKVSEKCNNRDGIRVLKWAMDRTRTLPIFRSFKKMGKGLAKCSMTCFHP
jgi:hypothetical protein